MINIAICDDNIDELSHIVKLIEEYKVLGKFNCEYTIFYNGLELIAALEKGKYFDIYCLDVVMPKFTGIEVAKEIRGFDKNAHIIFLSSSAEFAIDSYSVKAINYILKPITKEILFEAINEILDQMKIEKENVIIIKSSEGLQKVLVSKIVYVEVIQRNVFYHMISGKVIKSSELFTDVYENLLKYKCFVKTHRSYVVNMSYIDIITSTAITLQTNVNIPIAQGKSNKIKEDYLEFQMGCE